MEYPEVRTIGNIAWWTVSFMWKSIEISGLCPRLFSFDVHWTRKPQWAANARLKACVLIM